MRTQLTPLERTQCLQRMLFGTHEGEMLRELMLCAGHFYTAIEDDRQRVEHNLIKTLFQACGVQIALQIKNLPATETERNLIDIINEGDTENA